MRARSKTSRYLEHLQKDAFGFAGIDPYPDDAADYAARSHVNRDLLAAVHSETGFPAPLEEVQREFEARIARGLAGRPTKCEDPFSFLHLEELADELDDGVRGSSFELPLRPTFGTLPLGQCNAMAIVVPDTYEYLEVFQCCLFSFVDLLS